MEEALVKRIMPNSLEAEQSVIGSMIMDKDAIVTAMEMLISEDFYHTQYGILFDTMIELYNKGLPVDLVTLQNKLKEKDVPPEIASLEFVRDLVTAVPTSANVKYYAQIVKDNSMRRKLIKLNEEIENECYVGKESVETVMDITEKKVFDLLSTRGGGGDYVPIRQVVMNALEKIENAAKTSGTVTGIPTGFIDLDYRTAGLQPSDLILIAARPSMGKTAFVLNIAQYVAFHENMCTAIFSLEMSKEQLVNRLFSLESRVDAQALRTGNLSDADWEKLIEGAGTIGNSELIIDDTPGISISEMRSKCRKYKLEHDLKLVIIDYLQLMSGSGKSTVANLIPRFWDVSEGEICIGGINIKEIATEDLMNLVSFVFQDSFLFFDTLYENIRVGNTSATREQVIEAARAAQCHDFIESLPDGYNTRIGDKGVYLSGGESQRVCVARAILKNAPILVLDEATAFADPENEYKMQQAIQRLIKDKTVIIIAHRLSSIISAGQILVLKEGRLIQSGRHEVLSKTDGVYKRMWDAYTSAFRWQLTVKKEETK